MSLNETRSLKRLRICVFLVLLLGFWPMKGAADDAAPTEAKKIERPERYDSSDFYYLDQEGKRVLLELDYQNIVIRFSGSFSKEDDFFAKMGWTENGVKIRKFKAPLGTEELKRVADTYEVYVVAVAQRQKVVEILNALSLREEILDALPVFKRNKDLVFAPGFWVRGKYGTRQEKKQLAEKISLQGYMPMWPEEDERLNDLGPRTNYYRRVLNSGGEPNVLRLARLVASDVLALWAVPDFVSLKPLVWALPKLSRPSGTINDEFRLSYEVRYEAGRIRLDTEYLKQLDPAELKPSDVAPKLFQASQAVTQDLPGELVWELRFKLYQPGKFALLALALPYSFHGARDDVPPEKFITARAEIIIAGLVPRDEAGKPLAKDIFGLKAVSPQVPSLPDSPEKVIYPSTDLRFYTKGLYEQNPGLGKGLKSAGTWLLLALFLGAASWGAIVTVHIVARIRRSPYAEFRRSARRFKKIIARQGLGSKPQPELRSEFLRSARRALRFVIGASEGKTETQLAEECSSSLRPLVSETLSLLKSYEDLRQNINVARTRRLLSSLRTKATILRWVKVRVLRWRKRL